MTRERRIDLVLALIAVALIVAAWFAGRARSEAELRPILRRALPAAQVFVKKTSTVYAAFGDAGESDLLGYVALGSADGYGGPLELAVAVNAKGHIIGLAEVSDKETPEYYDRVAESDLPASLLGKSATDRFQLGDDVDGVSGATYTSRALAKAALDGSREAAEVLGLPTSSVASPRVKIGLAEVTVLALFAFAFVSRRRWFKHKKLARWLSLLLGLVVIGFILNLPLTLAFLTKLILGYWPAWQTNLYWYILLVGVLVMFIVRSDNVYCDRICPFGAAQECMAAIGGAKVRTPSRFRRTLRWLPRVLALGAVLIGVYYRSPGIASYELFGTLFTFKGSGLQFLALGLVLLGALAMRRWWCRYLCPVGAVMDWIQIVREGVVRLWQRLATKASAA